MKTKKIVKFATLSLLVAPMVLGSLQGVSANEKQTRISLRDDDTPPIQGVDLTLHKLQMSVLPDPLKQNTGHEMDLSEFGTNVKRLDGVSFTIHNITDAYYLWQSEDQKNTSEEFQKLVAAGQVEIADNSFLVMVKGKSYGDRNAATVTGETTNGGATTVNLQDKTKGRDSAYIIFENDPKPEVVTQAAIPMFLLLPVYKLGADGKPTADLNTNIHLYPKNIVGTGSITGLKKIQTLDGYVPLKGAEFVIHRGDINSTGVKYLGPKDAQGVRPWVDTLGEAEVIKTNVDGELSMTDIPNGDYLISEISREIDNNDLGLIPENAINRPFEIKDNGTVAITGVENSFLNDDLVVDKDNKSKDYEYGEAIRYTVKTTVPSAIVQKYQDKDEQGNPVGDEQFRYTSFTLRDEHDSELAYITDSLIFKSGDEDLEFEVNKDYTIEVNEANNKFTISFIISDASKIMTLAGKTLTVEYDMKIVGESPADELFNNKVFGETSFIDYDTKEGNDGDEDDGEDVFTGGRKFVKIDIDSNKSLAGAKFYITQIIEGEEKALYRDANGDNYWGDLPVMDKDIPAELVILESSDQVGQRGLFEVQGLNYGKYKLMEFSSPEGYILPAEGFDFEVTKDSYTGKNQQLAVKNKAEGSLPATGGIGTIVFFLVGGLTMAGTYVATRRRKN